MLEAALRVNAGDANAHYLLGLWYLNAQKIPEGAREGADWRSACGRTSMKRQRCCRH